MALLAAAVVVELRLVVAPSIVGSGQRLFDGLPPIRLETTRSTASPSGHLLVDYRVVRKARWKLIPDRWSRPVGPRVRWPLEIDGGRTGREPLSTRHTSLHYPSAPAADDRHYAGPAYGLRASLGELVSRDG